MEPQKLGAIHSVREVLIERRQGQSRVLEDPCPAELLRVAFRCVARVPVSLGFSAHGRMHLRLVVVKG